MQHFSVWEYDQFFDKLHRYTSLQAKQWDEQGRDTSCFKLLVRPAFRFFREYILQGAILDGKAGIQTAWLAAFYSFSKQARLWEIKHGRSQAEFEDCSTGIELASAEAERERDSQRRRAA